MKSAPSYFSVFTICLISILILGCSQTNQIEPKDGILGQWQGKWYCEKTGHEGPLKCKLLKIEDNKYKAKYSGSYTLVVPIPFWYSVDMEITKENGQNLIQAESDLGWLGGGKYTYTGTITDDEFLVTYNSKNHNGTFELFRPGVK